MGLLINDTFPLAGVPLLLQKGEQGGFGKGSNPKSEILFTTSYPAFYIRRWK